MSVERRRKFFSSHFGVIEIYLDSKRQSRDKTTLESSEIQRERHVHTREKWEINWNNLLFMSHSARYTHSMLSLMLPESLQLNGDTIGQDTQENSSSLFIAAQIRNKSTGFSLFILVFLPLSARETSESTPFMLETCWYSEKGGKKRKIASFRHKQHIVAYTTRLGHIFCFSPLHFMRKPERSSECAEELNERNMAEKTSNMLQCCVDKQTHQNEPASELEKVYWFDCSEHQEKKRDEEVQLPASSALSCALVNIIHKNQLFWAKRERLKMKLSLARRFLSMCVCPAQWKQHISSIEFYLDLWTAKMRCRNWFDLASVRSDRTRIEGYFGSHECARTRNWTIHSAHI